MLHKVIDLINEELTSILQNKQTTTGVPGNLSIRTRTRTSEGQINLKDKRSLDWQVIKIAFDDLQQTSISESP